MDLITAIMIGGTASFALLATGILLVVMAWDIVIR